MAVKNQASSDNKQLVNTVSKNIMKLSSKNITP